MPFLRAACITFLRVLAMPQISRAIIPCASKKSQWGYTLESSAYDSSPAENYPTCLLRCLTDTSRCRTLSYDLAAQICELSVESRWSKPGSFKQKEDSIYMEMLGVIEILTNTTQPPVTQAITEPPVTQATTEPPVDQDTTHPSVTQAITQPPVTHNTTQSPVTQNTTQPPAAQNATQPPAISANTETTPSTQATSSSGDEVSVDGYCSGKSDGDYPHPNSCGAYIRCTSSLMTINFCPVGKKFHRDNKVCDFEENVVCP